ncbi:MarR family winged helix-turn-helix transcriptional regulator [Streptomyces sp. NPDC058623]|uniref:MarR family winged helix-turn-helix transcriptional regulator n=1 Tax=Streptomyces sp. NPDC058623 TaxID=3346563 RepID=UPI0036678DD9
MSKVFPSLTPEPEDLGACAVAEMLEVLWGHTHGTAALDVLPPSQLRALTVIEQRDGINLRDLGEALGSAASAVSRLCDRLEAAGMVQRSRVRTNRREVELSLSRRGKTVLAQTRAARKQKTVEVLERMSSQHQRALAEGLAAFRAAAAAHVGLYDETCVEDDLPVTA